MKSKVLFSAVIIFFALLTLSPRFLNRYWELEVIGGHYPRENIVRSYTEECQSDRGVSFTKKFVYLIETESCIPKELLSPEAFGNSSACQCDVIVLGYIKQCTEDHQSYITHLFKPKSTWATGREALYKTSLQQGKKILVLHIYG